jgi:hypothetical protein
MPLADRISRPPALATSPAVRTILAPCLAASLRACVGGGELGQAGGQRVQGGDDRGVPAHQLEVLGEVEVHAEQREVDAGDGQAAEQQPRAGDEAGVEHGVRGAAFPVGEACEDH